MKMRVSLVLAGCLSGAFASSAWAADKGSNKDDDNVFTRFDTNKNGVLDPDEIVALKEAFKNGDPALKVYDTNGDGVLDENEIAAIKPPEKGKKKKK